MVATIGSLNPFRYRGYFYDEETGFYYLKSRYYDPEVGRFINADNTDVLTVSPMKLIDKNLYSYCENNPVNKKDIEGYCAVALVLASSTAIGAIMGAFTAAATGGNVWESALEGAITGFAGAALGLLGVNPIMAGIIGASLDVGFQIGGNILKRKKDILKVDLLQSLKVGIQMWIGVKVPQWGNATKSLLDAAVTSFVWGECTIILSCVDIVVINSLLSYTESKKKKESKRIGPIKGISH